MVYIRSRDARKIQYPPYIKSAADILNTDKTIDLIWGTVLSDILVDGKMSRMRVTQSLAPFFTFQFLPSISIHTLQPISDLCGIAFAKILQLWLC